MGARMTEYYTKAEKEFGLQGRMKLALLTAIPSSRAETEADSAENLQKFEKALAQLKTEKK